MIILRLLFLLFIAFCLLVFGLGVVLWLKLRVHLNNPFLRHEQPANDMQNDKVIEGEYKVLKD
jgi:hypothetical protein